MKILVIFKRLFKKLFQGKDKFIITYKPTLTKKEYISYLKTLKQISIRVRQIERGRYTSGHAAPTEITKVRWFNNF